MWTQSGLGYLNPPITEGELFKGNRDHEKFLEDNFDKIMAENTQLAHRLDDLRGLINELRMSPRG
jgi:hypothetical protein